MDFNNQRPEMKTSIMTGLFGKSVVHIFIFLCILNFKMFGQDAKIILPVDQGINIRYACFSYNSKYVASTQEQTIKLWDVSTGRLIKNIQEKAEYVTFSHNNKYILTDNGNVWDIANSGPIFSRNECASDFSKDDRYILSTNDDKVNIYELKTGRLYKQLLMNLHGYKRRAFFSHDEKSIITWYEKSVEIWGLDKNNLVRRFIGKEYLRWASFSPGDSNIVTSNIKGDIIIWDVLTGKEIKRFKDDTITGREGENSLNVPTVSYSHDGKDILSATFGGNINVWDVAHGKIKLKIHAHTDRANSAFYSADGKWIISASWDKSVKMWDAATGNLEKSFFGSINIINGVSYSRDGKYMAVITDSCIKLCDAGTLNVVHVFREREGFLQQAEFTPDGKFIITKGAVDHALHIWNLSTHQLEKNIPNDQWAWDLKISPTGKYVAIINNDPKRIKIWDLKEYKTVKEVIASGGANINSFEFDERDNILYSDGNEIRLVDFINDRILKRYLIYDKSEILFLQFSSDFHNIVSTSKNAVRIYNSDDGHLIKQFVDPNGKYQWARLSSKKEVVVKSGDSVKLFGLNTSKQLHSSKANIFGLTPNEQYLIGYSTNNSLEFFDIEFRRPSWLYFMLYENDFFATLYDESETANYYYATKNSAKSLFFGMYGRQYPFEQLDIKYNRPDLVLNEIRNSDTALIGAFRNAYLKRIKKLGLDTNAFTKGFDVPEAEFVNRDSIDYDRSTRNLKLHIVGKDSSSKLDRFNIWINETPLFGIRGLSFKHREIYDFDTTLTVVLSDSLNNIETSVTNINGIESYHLPLQVNYIPKKPGKTKIYFLGIGLDKFQDTMRNLFWSVNDVRNLAIGLKKKYGGDIIIDTLFNQDATIRKVKELKNKLYRTTINDKVIVAYSGHGLLSDNFDYYLSTYNINFNKPEEGGLSYDILEDLLDSIPARQKLMLLDACHSGEVDKEEMEHYKRVESKLKVKGTILENKDTTRLGMKDSFELMQELFVNVSKSTGATVISAAAGTQFALERLDLRDGVFTYSILEYMKEHTSCTVAELKDYVNKRVSELTDGLQQPTARAENITYDWKVW
jgi:WD40 repeat protein